MDIAEEQKLVIEARQSSDGFGKLYDYYFPKVYGFVKAKIANRTDAEDVVSEIFMKVLENLPKFEWRGLPFGAWVFTIARNTLNDYYRRTAKYKTSDIDEAYDVSHDEEKASPHIKASKNELMEIVKKVMNNLSEREATVVQLKFFSQLSNREIVHVTGLSESNVAVILYRTLRKIKPDLQYFV